MIGSIFFEDLYKQYSWYDNVFTPILQNCSKEFFFDGFEYKLISAGTNMNILSQNDTFFVTKVKINAKNDIYIRISQDAINVILDKVLGKNNRKFDLTEVSELEARIITKFNDFLYESLAPNFHIEPNKRYSEILHITYFVKSEISETAAKLIISLPKDILSPEVNITKEPKFTDEDFTSCPVEVKLLVGTTNFSLSDIKKLDKGDIVVLENSASNEMTLVCDNIVQKFQINPNESIVEPYDMTGGKDMDNNVGLWDSIQVDVTAEFEKVKMTLGELKSIEEGLVIDMCSVYNNKVSLRVGNKSVAEGELVIINDRFGVKIDKIKDDTDSEFEDASAAVNEGDEDAHEQNEEFDYSDFEVENN